jgi:ABC-2 type transport system ATP-binding protein
MSSVTTMTGGGNAIEVKGLSYAFGRKRVLAGLDLSVPTGSTMVLLGANGAGKTTLLRLLCGMLEPASGSIRERDLDPTRQRDRLSERLGFVPDAPDAWPWMTVVELGGFLAAHHPRWNEGLARELRATMGVPLDRRFRDMSRGEATKAVLATTLAHEPEVLLLDEPFGGLDPMSHQEVLECVVRSLEVGARTVLVSTHDLDVAARLGDHVAVLVGGSIGKVTSMDDATAGDAPRREALRGMFTDAVRGGRS